MASGRPFVRARDARLEIVISESPIEVVEVVDPAALRAWQQAAQQLRMLKMLNPAMHARVVAELEAYAALADPTPEDDARHDARMKAIASGS